MINRKSILFFHILTFLYIFIVISYQVVYANDNVPILPFCFTADNQPISDCKTAIAYRDGQLVEELKLVNKLFEDNKNKDEFIGKTIEKMQVEINKVKSEWDKCNEKYNKRIAVKITTMALAVMTNKLTDMILSKNTDLSAMEKDLLKNMEDRSNTLMNTLATEAVTGDFSIDGMVSLPVSMIFTLNPTLNITFSTANTVLDWSELVLLFWDKEVEKEYYKKRSDILEKSIKILSDKYIMKKIENLMYIKNEIDRYCSKNSVNTTSIGYINKVSNNDMNLKETSNCPSSTAPSSTAPSSIPTCNPTITEPTATITTPTGLKIK